VRDNEALLDELKAVAMQALEARKPASPVDREAIGALIRTSIRQFINQRFQRKPVVLPLVMEV
jgi:mRNA degradation ribonuclease J1/J2